MADNKELKMRYLGVIPLIVGCVSDNIIEKQSNDIPTILITSHSDGAQILEGYVESFRATASDEDHNLDELAVIWYVGEEVACDWATVEPDGTSECEIVFEEGDESVIAEIRDPVGAAGVSEVSVVIEPTDAPIVALLTPITGENYYSDQLIQFSATVSDTEDAAEDLVVLWSSSLDGDLSLDTTVDSNGELSDFAYLTEGEHAIELRVEDLSGKFSTEEVVIQVSGENNIPGCEITEPVDGAAFVFGDMITFRGIAEDVDIPSNELVVEWVSDKDGSIGLSTPTSAGDITFSYDGLSADSHTVSLNVSDEVGAVCTAQVLVHVGTLPIAQIDEPLSGAVFSVGDAISFQGTATDQEDQPNELAVVWTSSLDGVLETGTVNSQNISEFTLDSLTTGLHSLSFTVTDSVGLTDEDSVSFRVNTPPEVDSIQLSPDPVYSNDQLTVAATDLDDDGDTVFLSYAWLENGVLTSFTGTTLSSSELDVGEIWTVRVTPNDGYVDGAYAEASITISNTNPTLTVPQISSSDGSNIYNDSVLTCSSTASDVDEPVTPTYSWSVGGNTYTGASLDLSITGASPTDSVECLVSVSDSNGGSATASAADTLDNRAPAVDMISFSPDPVYWNQDLSVTATYLDDDGDSVTPTYAWYESGVLTAFTTDTIPASELDTGEVWTIRITPNDDHENGAFLEASITIENQVPSVNTVVITPNTGVTTGSELVCSGAGTDPEEGALTPTYEWYVNANLLGSSDTLQLDNSMVSPSDWVECVATVTDAQGEYSFAIGLAQVENTAPTVDSISLSPSAVNPLDTLTCSATASDLDGAAPTLSFVFNNLTTSATYAPTSVVVQDATLDLSTVAINPGEQLECVVTATDIDGGQASDSVSITMDWDAPAISVSVSHSGSGSFYVDDLLTCSGTASDYAGNDLSSQIQYQWINTSNGNSILSTTTDYTIDASQVDVGDILECVGTITDSFGEVSFASQNNMVISVNNSQPFFTVTPALSSYAPYDGETVTCSATFSDPDDPNLSALSVDYQWVNASMADQVITTGTDTYTVDLNDVAIGEELRCHVILQDAQGETVSEFSPIATIQNAPPVLTTPVITPNTGVVMGTELTCSATATDAETGPITPTYQWMVGNTVLNTSNMYTVDSNDLSIGDTLTCLVEAHDGQVGVTDTASVIIDNIDPTVSNVQISSGSGMFYNDEVLTCTATTDDAESTPIVSYSWDSNGVVLGSTDTLDLSTTSLLPSASITCTVTVDDSYVQVSDSATEAIGNRSPSTPTVSISWSGTEADPTPDDDLSCLGSGSTDLDSQTVTYSYAWTSDTGGSVAGDTVLSTETTEGETWSCTVTATDGSLSAEGTDSVLIINSVDLGVWTDCPAEQSLADAQFQFIGESPGGGAGRAVSSAGDVDGDGLDDLLIGAHISDENGTHSGKAYLMLGSSLSAGGTIDLSQADYSFIGKGSYHYLGDSLSSAGDVDGDGLSDFLLTERGNSDNGNHAGKVYLFLGSSLGVGGAVDLSQADYIFEGEAANNSAGWDISFGDADNDGLSDILISAFGNSDNGYQAGKVYLFLGSSLGAGGTRSVSTADYTFLGEVAGDRLGSHVSFAGDVDGDGLDDILLEASVNNSGVYSSKIYLILGSSLGVSGAVDLAQADYSFIGHGANDNTGSSISSAGDVDGDGLDDILIGSRSNDDEGTNVGKAFLVLGASLGSNSTVDLSTADYIIFGENVDDHFGNTVAPAGDVNADGLDDFLIGSYNGNGTTGKGYLILGSSLDSSGTINAADADYSFLGENAGDYAGWSIASAGDIDGNGSDDIFIGAFGYDGNSLVDGKAAVFRGCHFVNSPPEAPVVSVTPSTPLEGDELVCNIDTPSTDFDGDSISYSFSWTVDGTPYVGTMASTTYTDDTIPAGTVLVGEVWECSVTPNDGTDDGAAGLGAATVGTLSSWSDCPADQVIPDADYTFTGENLGDQAGYSTTSAGDVDGDGLDDILIGAYMNDAGGADAGKAYLILRSSLGGSSSIDLSTADYEFIGENSGDYAGYTVSKAGDVDGDGLGDILIGAYYGNGGGGRAYLFLGASLGGTASIDLSTADYIFNSVNNHDRASHSMAPAGDVDGDGLDDFLIGAFGDDSNGADAGGAYLILGGSLGGTSTISLANVDYHFLGEVAGDKAGVKVSGAGDVDGDGFDDILVGAPYNDENGNDAGKGYLILGSSLGNTSSIFLSNADYSFVGEDLLDYVGRSMAPAGDVDGDGLDDILIGAYGDATAGANNSGKTYLLLGSALGGNSVIDLAADPAYEFLSEGVDEYAGLFVSSAGDMDGDGFPDILISAPYYDGSGWNFGKVYAILAASLGGTKSISLASADYTFLGQGDGDIIGYTISVLEGGRAPEILFGAPYFTGSSVARGHTFLYTPCAP